MMSERRPILARPVVLSTNIRPRQTNHDQVLATHQTAVGQQKAPNDAIHPQMKTQSEIAPARIKADLDTRMTVLGTSETGTQPQ
jgi:hypothetical protein